MVLVRAFLHYHRCYHEPDFWQGLVAWPKKRHNLGPEAAQALHYCLVAGRSAYMQGANTEQESPLTRILDQWICSLAKVTQHPPTVPDAKARQLLREDWARLLREGHLSQLATRERPWRPAKSSPVANERQRQKEDGDDDKEPKDDPAMKSKQLKEPRSKHLFSDRLGQMETVTSGMNTRIEVLRDELVEQFARRNKDVEVVKGWHQEHDLTIASLSRLIVGLEARLENAERELLLVRKELDEHISGYCNGTKQVAPAQRSRPSTGGFQRGQRPAWS
ncbi:uncharacterized protein E0L32_011014 [Thyridium curvatum]|uniref:Uncharacterized protein n=1 Tax=Thyridium curvatum TaxID=1093900 RepID=A0A507AKW6_9PEZI|nr:uncharacterized protein E0L32_011014 [Thyridium curvatum]TPX07026.1 hypothetical protein E0L32_011014 [Thyridium curvatum]